MIPHIVIFLSLLFSFFFNDTATTEIYTLSLHDALPIYPDLLQGTRVFKPLLVIDPRSGAAVICEKPNHSGNFFPTRSEEHTSELQSRRDLVCRLLLEKKKNKMKHYISTLSKR